MALGGRFDLENWNIAPPGGVGAVGSDDSVGVRRLARVAFDEIRWAVQCRWWAPGERRQWRGDERWANLRAVASSKKAAGPAHAVGGLCARLAL